MTRDERAAARERCEAATPPPWERSGRQIERWDMATGEPLMILYDEGGHSEADAEFIQHARTDLPAALDALDRLTPAWSADTPTRPGWYWFRDEPGDEPNVVEVFVVDARLRVFDGAEVVDAAEWGGEWAGPIPPPA